MLDHDDHAPRSASWLGLSAIAGRVREYMSDGRLCREFDWLTPDESVLRPMVEESAAKYAKEKNITPRDCAKES